MLIVRRAGTNNLVVTMSMNRTLNNPFYLFSFQHIASNEFVRFYPTVLSSNTRYDLISFVESTTQNLSATPPAVSFPYLGQYYYSIYEMASSGTTNPLNAYSKLESGRAWLINDNDNDEDCYYDEYISDNEIDEKDIYVDDCDAATPTPTPTPSITPTITPTITPSSTLTPTPTPTATITPTITPSSTLTPTPTPTATITTTPTPSSTLTPTPTPTNIDLCDFDLDFITPTPTVTPSSTLTPTPTPTPFFPFAIRTENGDILTTEGGVVIDIQF